MKNLKIILAISAVIIVAFIVVKSWDKSAETTIKAPTAIPAATFEIKPNDWVVGNPNANVTLIEYLDFECESCKAYHPLITQLKEEYKDSLQFVVRYFPLPGHKNSRTSAYAVEAAGKQGKFWDMYDILYTKQSEWGEQPVANQDQFEKYATEAGVNIEQWKKDIVSSEVLKRVDDSFKEAMSLNLQGTPAFFLNGKRIQNPKSYEAFKQLIQAEISNAAVK